MPSKSSVDRHRERRAGQGFVRVEVSVRKEDAGLVRDVAAALTDPSRERTARRLLRQSFAGSSGAGLKALLASAPLDGIDLERSRDMGRDIEF